EIIGPHRGEAAGVAGDRGADGVDSVDWPGHGRGLYHRRAPFHASIPTPRMLSLAKYKIDREIQSGASAILYAGRRTTDQLPVILKAPRCEVQLPSPRQIASLRHELTILADLPIPGVLKGERLEVEEGGAALVFEGFTGQPLYDVTRARRLELGEI